MRRKPRILSFGFSWRLESLLNSSCGKDIHARLFVHPSVVLAGRCAHFCSEAMQLHIRKHVMPSVEVLWREWNLSAYVKQSVMTLKVVPDMSASVVEQMRRSLSTRVLNETFNGTTTNEVRQPSYSLFLVGNM